MNDLDRDLVFSESVKAGKRIYYFDVKQSRNGDKYIAITESKKINEGSYENPRISFEKHKLFLYKEDYDKFLTALLKTVEVARSGEAEFAKPGAYEGGYSPAPVAEAVSAPSAPETPAPAPVAEAAPAPAPEPESASIEAPVVEEETISSPQPIKIDLDF